ncbi:transposase [Metarhizium album ARSEF 1941]|uniref:Transposase n=1 Tax=Metarhizium album (strain ARSEF 1941) TaxID=1081103 RepID=A0A0B2WQM9_METAS|nr:transposase [Metarhizium album ARSEF 1941]KHN98366.1 transposase [Metarhizium album ARSEF 1941]
MAATSVQTAKSDVELRVNEALEYIEENPGAKIRSVAKKFNVPRSRLQRRANGVPARKGHPARNTMLSREEEVALCNYIDRLDKANFAVRPEFITDAANYILKERASSTAPPRQVGTRWTTRFIQRHHYHKGLQKKIDSSRKASEDVTRALSYYNKLKEAIQQYGVPPEDIWNMDETGFRIGMGKDHLVVTKRRRAHLFSMPENRETATAIECISAGGKVIPAFLILTGQKHMESWYRIKELEANTKITVSPTGFTNDEIAVAWIQHFQEFATPIGRYRLLILDGHGSHHTIEFVEYCEQHDIIPFALPSHLTHILQPLDVVIFQPLKHYHAKALDIIVRDGVLNITKIEFLACIQAVRKQAFKTTTILTAFRKTGISPYNPQPVIEALEQRAAIYTSTPSPPPLYHNNSSDFETPTTLRQINKVANKLGEVLEDDTSLEPEFARNISRFIRGSLIAATELMTWFIADHPPVTWVGQIEHKSNYRLLEHAPWAMTHQTLQVR